MKKANLLTFLFLCFLVVGVILYMFFKKDSEVDSIVQSDKISSVPSVSASEQSKSDKDKNVSSVQSTKTFENESSEIQTSKTQTSETKPIPNISMNDMLFIGDSRTVGIMEYAGINDADYFCAVGMSVYNVGKKTVSVPNVGKVTLTELLNRKKYDKIYIMLGINEVGYKLESTVKKYGELLDFIKSRQNDAVIFIQANLHVTKKLSDKDKVVNNIAIDRLNTEFSKFADGKTEFYLDANVLFDDKNGGLDSDKSEDSTHLYAKYYKEWGKWIIKQTALLMGEK